MRKAESLNSVNLEAELPLLARGDLVPIIRPLECEPQ